MGYDLHLYPQSIVNNDTYRYTLQSTMGKRFNKVHSNQTGFYLSRMAYGVDIK